MLQDFVRPYEKEANRQRELSGLKTRQFYYNISNLKPAEGQELAFQIIENYTIEFMKGIRTDGILLIGGIGSGKTLMASSVANSIINYKTLRDNKINIFDFKVLDTWWLDSYYNIVNFISVYELFERYKATPYPNFFCKFKECPLLILDDLGAEKSNEFLQAKLFEIIDYRYNEYLPIIITTNCVPEELKEHVGHRTYDRIRSMCSLVSVTAKSQRKTATV